MLDKEEKKLYLMAYYQGVCDNTKMHTPPMYHKSLDEAVPEAIIPVFNELGLGSVDSVKLKDIMDFMKELDVITGYLVRENGTQPKV